VVWNDTFPWPFTSALFAKFCSAALEEAWLFEIIPDRFRAVVDDQLRAAGCLNRRGRCGKYTSCVILTMPVADYADRRAAHGTETRWTQCCTCCLCCKAKADAVTVGYKRRAHKRLPPEEIPRAYVDP